MNCFFLIFKEITLIGLQLVWEKGGPGLVFYTDAQYWREQEGDFDEQTTDEWDVDMSVYYDEGEELH